MNTLKDKLSSDKLSSDKLSSDKLTTNIFVLEFDTHSLQGILEVNDFTVSFTVESLQELKEVYGAVTIGQVVDTFSEEIVAVEFSEEVLEMIQDAVYDYAVESLIVTLGMNDESE